ncbi:beta-ketoacyl-[acyl-carrier-protein] synthase family protein [Cryptosporangium aurantiacum]|uniref:3-oxoacyl-[acyl-carrier-protein] synthase II n=1 Tax=Cryptosporangium aurantiacum TaxID=134849 RepID=A0A1M7QAM0_9ACTN|nr:beta-ketoacyl-[acyl-carrier-protein] synthase family protein [Cryptosporangium aurantiacum]SHN27709.1 3-oxoacyl-[acyl-carrier-protein] synthase II [Cryptosporangium aurantiacum]
MTGGRIRVAVTGIGVKSPAGTTVGAAFDALLAGVSLTRRCADGETPYLAGIVPQFDVASYFPGRGRQGADRTAELGLAAAVDAVRDSGLRKHGARNRWAVTFGTGGAGVASAAEALTQSWDAGHDGFTAHTVPMLMPSATAARIGLRFGVTGPVSTHVAACASSTVAIGEGLRAIRSGMADVVLAGGAEACLSPLVVEAFRRLGALSSRVDRPADASRPFDAARDGFVLAEGAAFLVLERWSHALSRNARIYAELAGYATNCDAHHMVVPRLDGRLAADCMAAALHDAHVEPREVGHVNAHATSTPAGDEAEAAAILRCFGVKAPPVTAPKGVTGHMIGASGAFETVVTVLSVQQGAVPPVANHSRQTDGAALDLVTGEPRWLPPAPALTNSFAFGGHNAALVVTPAR